MTGSPDSVAAAKQLFNRTWRAPEDVALEMELSCSVSCSPAQNDCSWDEGSQPAPSDVIHGPPGLLVAMRDEIWDEGLGAPPHAAAWLSPVIELDLQFVEHSPFA